MYFRPLPPIRLLRRRFIVTNDGRLIWRDGRHRGREAGCVLPNGYRLVGIGKELFRAHRIVHAIMSGRDPGQRELDHINRRKPDNANKNLRKATRALNMANSGLRSTNKSGHKGVCFDKFTGKWMATITIAGKRIWLGRFRYKTHAVQARKRAELIAAPRWANPRTYQRRGS